MVDLLARNMPVCCPIFVSLTWKILFWRKIKLTWSDTDVKKLPRNYISTCTSKAAGSNKG